jgi:hypothetical protein
VESQQTPNLSGCTLRQVHVGQYNLKTCKDRGTVRTCLTDPLAALAIMALMSDPGVGRAVHARTDRGAPGWPGSGGRAKLVSSKKPSQAFSHPTFCLAAEAPPHPMCDGRFVLFLRAPRRMLRAPAELAEQPLRLRQRVPHLKLPRDHCHRLIISP